MSRKEKKKPGVEPHALSVCGNRYPVAYKQELLAFAQTRQQEGRSVADLCRKVGVSRASYDLWRKKETLASQKPGPKDMDPEVAEACRTDIENLYHGKRRSMGTADIYLRYRGQIPRRQIAEWLREQRRYWNKEERAGLRRYEFTGVHVAWAMDFVAVKPEGRVLRMQEERIRIALGGAHRVNWEASDVARFFSDGCRRYGRPYFPKFDRGSEFRSRLFLALLRGLKVIPIPSRGHYPQGNGKDERSHGEIRKWLINVDTDLVTKEDVFREFGLAMLDQNQDRPKSYLGNRTAEEVFRTEKRMVLDRNRLYGEWSALKDRILGEWQAKRGMLTDDDVLDAMRIAAYRILEKWNLVVYSQGSERPGVLPNFRPEVSN